MARRKNSSSRTTTGTSSPFEIQNSVFEIVSIYLFSFNSLIYFNSPCNDAQYNNENINNEQYFQAQRLVTDSISQQMATGTDCKESNTGCYP